MEPYVISFTVIALLVALQVLSLVRRELVQALRLPAADARPDIDALGPDAGLWPGLFRPPLSR